MSSTFYISCMIAKLIFALAFICILIIIVSLLLFFGFFNPSEIRELGVNLICGGIYTLGSFFSIGERFDKSTMLILGVLLNVLGSVWWLPTLGTSESYIALIGIILTLIWCLCIILRITSAQKKGRKSSCLW